MAANPDEVVNVGGGAPQQQQPVHPDAVTKVGADPADQVTAINGVSTQPKTGFWSDFGTSTGGVWGLAKAPFTESIPAELSKAAIKDPETYAVGGFVGLAVKKFDEFLKSDDSKPITDRLHESYGALKEQAKQHPGAIVGSLLKGLITDPELFFAPGLGEAGAAAKGAAVAKAVGAGEKAAKVAGAVSGGAARVGGAAAIGGGAEFSRELGEGEALDPGNIGLSSVIGGLAGGVLQVHGKKPTRMSPEEIDEFLTPSAQTSGAPHPEPKVTPTADGYLVHSPGSTDGKTFGTKEEAEAAAREISATARAYRGVNKVTQGTT